MLFKYYNLLTVTIRWLIIVLLRGLIIVLLRRLIIILLRRLIIVLIRGLIIILILIRVLRRNTIKPIVVSAVFNVVRVMGNKGLLSFRLSADSKKQSAYPDKLDRGVI